VLTSTDHPQVAFPRLRLPAHGPLRRRCFLCWVPLAALAAVLSQSVVAEPIKAVRRILILNEVNNSFPAINIINQGIQAGLQNSPYELEFYLEYFDTTLFPDPATQQEFRDFYIHKYQNRRPDVIVTVGPAPLNFMSEVHESTFPGVPIIFCVPHGHAPPALDSDFTGVVDDLAPAETLEIALRLQPGTKHVVVAGGVGDWDKREQTTVKENLEPFRDRVDISYLTDLAMPDLLDRLRHLPDHTVVILTSMAQDAAGMHFKSGESGPMIAAAANAPVFTLYDVFLGHGEVGGDLSSFSAQGKIAGEVALKILNGGRPQDIPKVRKVTNYMFDWRAVKRWGLKEAALPAGSIVINRRPGFWELYKEYVLAGILIFLAQAMAILGLLWQRARRRKTEAELRRSEQKFSKSFRQSPLAISIASTNKDCYLEVNETFEELTGWKRDEVVGRSHPEIGIWVDHNRRSAVLKQLLAGGNVQDLEIRIRRKDGQIRTTLGSAELIEVDGENCCLSVWADITERKQAEQALASMSHKLIEAQEKERSRIARELHDDINQRIALFAVELEQLRQSNLALDEVRRRMLDLGRHITEIGIEVQAISHRLHSSKLEILGLVSACRSFCKEVAEQHKVTVDFAADGVPREVPQDVSLCVFRILQESLNNAIKHSGAHHFEVRLSAMSDEIQLTVHDCGAGFDVPAALSGQGLGLISMRERAGLVKGTISITSKPIAGTEITLHVPFAVNRESQTISGAA
jgi:PAS domain S-box-containing protein